MANRKEAVALWEQMDDLGYAGKLGSNKPEATRQVLEAYGVQGGEQIATEVPQRARPFLMPMTDAEQREAARRATEARLQPSGHYRSRRARQTGIKSPIDDASHMRGINEVGMRRALSRR